MCNFSRYAMSQKDKAWRYMGTLLVRHNRNLAGADNLAGAENRIRRLSACASTA